MIKKILLAILIVMIVFVIYIYIAWFYRPTLDLDDSVIVNDIPQTQYEQDYPIEDYVSQNLESIKIIQQLIISGMIHSDDIKQITDRQDLKNNIFAVLGDIDSKYTKQINELQYTESQVIELQELPENEKNTQHNYEYVGYDEYGNEVTGYISLYNSENYSIAVSFLNEDLTVNTQKAKLLVDDSNAEKLAYDIVEETQKIYGTNMEPNEASKYYYNSTIEQLAGSLSYHAFVTLWLNSQDATSEIIEHAATANISLIDNDSFFVNRAF